MWRMYLAGLGLASLVALFGGGAWWHHAAITTAYAQGLAAGRAQIEAQMQAEITRQRGAAEAALAVTDQKIAELAAQRDKLQDNFNELDATIRKSHIAGDKCLDAGLLRALNALGRAGSGPHP